MFAGIAGRYDLANRVLSGGVDRSWRRKVMAAAGSPGPGSTVVDVACGGILLLGILNATWMRAIVKHAVKEYRSARPSEASTTPIPSQKKSSPRLTTSANACL